MVQIEFTNIIIDDFATIKNNPFNKYVHFLSHIHTDHLKGLNNSWGYGKIYCTQITKELVLLKYPGIKNIVALSLNEQHSIQIGQELQVTVTLFDANHCAGSAMILFQGYFGRVLYTGDFRFDKQIFSKYRYLYPQEKLNSQFDGCSKHIDVMHMDNTFLDKRFDFPRQEQAYKIAQDFVRQCQKQKKRVYLGMQNYGKQQVLVKLAKQFETLIVVDDTRYEGLIAMKYDHELFTTKPQQGWIQVVPRKSLNFILNSQQNSAGIVLTGWINKPGRAGKQYRVPYSLHSNFQQIIKFVKSIRPSQIKGIVVERQPSGGICQNQSNGRSMYQPPNYAAGIKMLRQNFCREITPQYQSLKTNFEVQKNIQKRLGINRTTEQINRQQLDMSTTFVNSSKLPRKGYKFNTERNQSAINQVKEKIKKKSQNGYRYSTKRTHITPNMQVNYQNQQQLDISDDDDDAVEVIEQPNVTEFKKKNQNQVQQQQEEQANQDVIRFSTKKQWKISTKNRLINQVGDGCNNQSKGFETRNHQKIIQLVSDDEDQQLIQKQKNLSRQSNQSCQNKILDIGKQQQKSSINDSKQNAIETHNIRDSQKECQDSILKDRQKLEKQKRLTEKIQRKYRHRNANIDQDKDLFKRASQIQYITAENHQKFANNFDLISSNVFAAFRKLNFERISDLY